MPVNATSIRIEGSTIEMNSISQMKSVIVQLHKDLHDSQAENQQLTDQMNVLVSLIKRSWKGDKTANIHLANIIGLQLTDMMDKPQSASQKTKTGCSTREAVVFEATGMENIPNGTFALRSLSVQRWEWLCLKLLERDYQLVKKEIEQRRQMYIVERTLYMDEVLASHHEDMKEFSRQQRPKIQQVDNAFLKQYRKGMINRPPSGVKQRIRSKSAGMTRSQVRTESQPERESEAKTCDMNSSLNKYPPVINQRTESYDNPQRYLQSDLFEIGEIIEPDMTLPFSSGFQKKQDLIRSRPKSASHIAELTFTTQKFDRPMKYETTRPISILQKDKNLPKDGGDATHWNAKLPEEEQTNGANLSTREKVRTPANKSGTNIAFYKPVRFEDNLKKMCFMEDEFTKNTLSLQKKLGIAPDGIVL